MDSIATMVEMTMGIFLVIADGGSIFTPHA
jgi:hypothetical protein